MYTTPPEFTQLVKNLVATADLTPRQAELIAHVELTLLLAIELGLEAEPMTVGWVLLSKMPLRHPLLENLSDAQKRMRANAAVIVPLSSRFGWENALIQYHLIPQEHRLFAVPHNRLDDGMISLYRQVPSPAPTREQSYHAILTEQLPYEKRMRHLCAVGKNYKVRAKIATDRRNGEVKFDKLPKEKFKDAWFEGLRPRTVIEFNIDDLLPTAKFLDEREQALNGREHWENDLKNIRYRRAKYVDEKLTLEAENAHPLRLEGTVHLPGMVSAGKTTLAKLIIAHCIRLGLDVRITLVVGDSHTAVEIAHQVNSWFYDDPSGDDVVAVPVLGKTQRETHLGRLLASREYARSLQEGLPHWGERWLMPTCPLSSQIVWEGDDDAIMPAGAEPCESLIGEASEKTGKTVRHLCPLFNQCPSKQMYRDMPRAQLWVTTPGALASASLPLHLERRILKLGDLVYEQSDLVILDEVETIVEWFDRTFAQREDLSNGKNGLLDSLDAQIAPYWTSSRVLEPHHRSWIIKVREAVKAVSGVLTAIANKRQERTVMKWVERGYFSPNQLAYRLARRLAGLKEWDGADLSTEQREANEALTQTVFIHFDQLLNQIRNPLRLQSTADLSEPVAELVQIMQALNTLTDEISDWQIFVQCRDWVERHYPDIEAKLAALSQALSESDDSYDKAYLNYQVDRSSSELAQRLQFMLNVALLDQHVHAVLHEWHNKPEMLDASQPFSNIPKGMRHILPRPLLGQQYGFSIHKNKQDADARNRLSIFNYVNIGRSYLLNFHNLRDGYDDVNGAHVLALSGTSYLPDSTTFHVDLPVSGVLMAPSATEEAIEESRFYWKPFKNREKKPIFISGAQDKELTLSELMQAMTRHNGVAGGFIAEVLERLESLGKKHSHWWADRTRILMLTNSYKQAEIAAQELCKRWAIAADSIFYLERGKIGEDHSLVSDQHGTLRRIDIEQFAHTGGKILFAPMQAIGRGFNILNLSEPPKAAFGAVFFLTRPLNPPHDIVLTAQELNRFALEWAKNPAFSAWQEDTLTKRALNARKAAVELRRAIERRRGYHDLQENADLFLRPREDLAATTAGRIVQAVGRLLRGGVPFHAYFVDAAWSPEIAKSGSEHEAEPQETSLLTALIKILMDYVDDSEIGAQLYAGLSQALITTEGRDSN